MVTVVGHCFPTGVRIRVKTVTNRNTANCRTVEFHLKPIIKHCACVSEYIRSAVVSYEGLGFVQCTTVYHKQPSLVVSRRANPPSRVMVFAQQQERDKELTFQPCLATTNYASTARRRTFGEVNSDESGLGPETEEECLEGEGEGEADLPPGAGKQPRFEMLYQDVSSSCTVVYVCCVTHEVMYVCAVVPINAGPHALHQSGRPSHENFHVLSYYLQE